MPGFNVTRREMLRWTALAAAAGPVATLFGSHRPVGARTAGSISPANLELVTLTEDRATFTWYTGYDARSAGVAVAPTVLGLVDGNAVSTVEGPPPATGPYRFTTPMPPPGDFLFSIVLCNDMHLGETTAGLVGALPQIQGISQLPGLAPYPELMLESLVADAQALGASYLLAAGDITAEAAPVDLSKAKELLLRFGARQSDWYAARGNHDREHDGDEWATCSIGPHGSPTTASATSSSPVTSRPGSRTTSMGSGSSASTPTTPTAAAAGRV